MRIDTSEWVALGIQLAQMTNDINDPASLRSTLRGMLGEHIAIRIEPAATALHPAADSVPVTISRQAAFAAEQVGSLGITFEEKSNALKASRFYPLAIERSHKEPYKDRVVTVRSRSGGQFSSHAAYGLSSPSAVSASWNATTRPRLKVWL